MEIIIKSAKAETYKTLGHYFYVEAQSGKHSATIVIKPTGVTVVVENASNRCWRGLGKDYQSVEVAVAAYKTPAIQGMIREAAALAAQPVAVLS